MEEKMKMRTIGGEKPGDARKIADMTCKVTEPVEEAAIDDGEFSAMEKRLMCAICPREPELGLGSHSVKNAAGGTSSGTRSRPR